MKPIDIIAGVVAWLLLLIVWTVVFDQARAQSRYDPDNRWIRDTLRAERHKHHDHEHVEVRRYRWEHAEPRRRYYGERRREREVVEDRHHHHESTRVYGFVARMTQTDRRDCHNGCCPPVENISSAHSNEGAAWNHAQLGWMKAISVRYGAMYADVQNADARTLVRQCFRCEFDESWIARNREALAQNTGTGNGFKTCCRIIASACIQPVVGASETPLKGDQKNEGLR